MRPWWLKVSSVAERLPLGKAPQIGANVALYVDQNSTL
jgi:hypothetical protein